jgi:hypothetical protein
MSLRFSPFLSCGEVQNSSRFRIWNSANKPGSQGCVARRRDSSDQLWAASSDLAFCEQFIGQLRLLEHDQTMRDSGDVCGARNTQFEQEFLGLFLGEAVSSYKRRDRIGDFCVAGYLAEHYTVHVVRYSTRFSLHLSRTSSALPTSDNHGERMLSASATDRALASLMTSDGTQTGKRSRLDWWAPLAVCSSHTLASSSSRNRERSLTNAGQRRRCTYVILPSTSLQTRTLGLSQIAPAARKISFPLGWPHQLPRMGPPTIASARFGRGPRPAWRTIP